MLRCSWFSAFFDKTRRIRNQSCSLYPLLMILLSLFILPAWLVLELFLIKEKGEIFIFTVVNKLVTSLINTKMQSLFSHFQCSKFSSACLYFIKVSLNVPPKHCCGISVMFLLMWKLLHVGWIFYCFMSDTNAPAIVFFLQDLRIFDLKS